MDRKERKWLENVSQYWRRLENRQTQRAVGDLLRKYTKRLFSRVRSDKSAGPPPKNGTHGWIDAVDIGINTMALEDIIHFFEDEVVAKGADLSRPSFFGFIPGSGHLLYSAANYISHLSQVTLVSQDVNGWSCDIEESVLKWVKGIVGYSDKSQGTFASGSSMGSVVALATARDAKLDSPDMFSKAVVYRTDQTHPCNIRALTVVGLRDCVLRQVPLDSDHRLDVAKLAVMVEKDQKAGLFPFLVIGTMGTTSFGIIDPMKGIADTAKKYGLWFHVDAAYGGFFLMNPAIRDKSEGIELSDSITLDCHKGLSAPFGTAVVLVREGHLLKTAMTRESASFFDVGPATGNYSPVDYSFEYTRPFRSFPVWSILKILGSEAITISMEEKLRLAQYVYKYLNTMPNVQVFSKPDLSIVAFRYAAPEHPKCNDSTKVWLEYINEEGQAFLTPALYCGLFYIRLCVLSFRSHIGDVDKALSSIRYTLSKMLSNRRQPDKGIPNLLRRFAPTRFYVSYNLTECYEKTPVQVRAGNKFTASYFFTGGRQETQKDCDVLY